HAGERRTHVARAEVAELVADRAGAGEERFALRDVAAFFDFGQQLRDGGVFFLRGRIAGGEDGGGLGRNAVIRMRAEPCDIARPERDRRQAAVLQRGEQRERGFLLLEQLLENRRRLRLHV